MSPWAGRRTSGSVRQTRYVTRVCPGLPAPTRPRGPHRPLKRYSRMKPVAGPRRSSSQTEPPPTLSVATIRMVRRYSVPMIAGAYTPTKILTAWEQGSDFIKVFPANIGGPEYIKALKGPLPQIPLVPTGGVELENIGAFLKAGASAFAVGGNLVNKKLIVARDFAAMTENAKRFAEAVHVART